VLPGYEPDPSIAPEPIPGAKRPPKQRRGGYQSRGRNGNGSSRPSRSKRGERPKSAPVLNKRSSNAAVSKDSRKRA
jgi:ATP-dependent RNA helicase RhlE